MWDAIRRPHLRRVLMPILIIEDDTATAEHLIAGLRSYDSVIESAADGPTGLAMVKARSYSLLVVDRMLPGLDGLSLVRQLRHEGREMPVLMVSALGELEDRVEGLDAGVDDYLAKPFAMTELRARLAALARRPLLGKPEASLRLANLTLDRLTREVRRADLLIELQPREFRLLEYLMTHAGRAVTRTMLLEHVWEFHFDPRTSVVETHISRLRGKIDRGFNTPLLHTVRGVGYALRAPD